MSSNWLGVSTLETRKFFVQIHEIQIVSAASMPDAKSLTNQGLHSLSAKQQGKLG